MAVSFGGWLSLLTPAFPTRSGVRRVIDVRSEFELRLWPDPYARHPQPGIRYIGIPMLDQLNSSDFADTLPACMFDV